MKYPRNLLLAFVIIILSNKPSNAEENYETVYQPAKALAEQYFDIAYDQVTSSPDSALYHGEKMKSIANEIKDVNLLAKSHFIIGYAYAEKKIYDVAAQYYYQGLDVVKDKIDKEGDMRRKSLYIGLGHAYEQTYNYDLALKYHSHALEIVENYDYDKFKAILHYNVGVILKKQKKYNRAKRYYNEAINVCLKINDKRTLARVYNSLGNALLPQGKYDSAKIYYLKAFDISEDIPSLENQRIYYLSNLGENYFKQDKYTAAVDQYLEALALSKQLNDVEKTRWMYNNLGDVYLKMKKYNQAIDYYNQSLDMKQNSKNALDEEYGRATKQIAAAYDAVGKYKLASEFNSKYFSHFDKVEETRQNLQQQNAQYRMKEVEWQRKLHEQQENMAGVEKEYLWSKIAIGVILLVLAFVYRKYYRIAWRVAEIRKIIKEDEKLYGI